MPQDNPARMDRLPPAEAPPLTASTPLGMCWSHETGQIRSACSPAAHMNDICLTCCTHTRSHDISTCTIHHRIHAPESMGLPDHSMKL